MKRMIGFSTLLISVLFSLLFWLGPWPISSEKLFRFISSGDSLMAFAWWHLPTFLLALVTWFSTSERMQTRMMVTNASYLCAMVLIFLIFFTDRLPFSQPSSDPLGAVVVTMLSGAIAVAIYVVFTLFTQWQLRNKR